MEHDIPTPSNLEASLEYDAKQQVDQIAPQIITSLRKSWVSGGESITVALDHTTLSATARQRLTVLFEYSGWVLEFHTTEASGINVIIRKK